MSFDYEDWMDERTAQRQAEREARDLDYDKENPEEIENLDYELENPDLDDWENKDVPK